MTDDGSGTTRVASVITATAVLIAVILFIYQVGVRNSVVLSILSGGILGIATITQQQNPDSTVLMGVTTVLLPVSAACGVASLGVAALESDTLPVLFFRGTEQPVERLLGRLIMHVGVTFGIGTGIYGAIITPRDGPTDGVLLNLWKQTAVIELSVGAVTTVLLLLRFNLLSETSLLMLPLGAVGELLIDPSSLSVGLFITGFETTIAAFLIGEVTQTVPIVEVASRARRDRLQTILTRSQTILSQFAVFSIGLSLLSIVAARTGWLTSLIRRIPPLALLIELSVSPGFRVFLIAIICICSSIIILIYIIQQLSGNIMSIAQSIAPVSIGVGVVITVALILSAEIQSVLSALPSAIQPQIAEYIQLISPVGIVLIYVEIALFALGAVLFGSTILEVIGYLPSHATGGAIAGTGLIGSSLLIGIFDQAPLIVFSGVALAIIAWDSSSHGVTAQSELGTRGGTRVTILHSLNTIAVALLGVGIAWGLQSTVVGLSVSQESALTGVLLVVPAVLIFLTILRG